MRTPRLAVLTALVLVLGACASSGSGVLSETRVTADQLAQTSFETVYDFIRAHSRSNIVSRQGREYITVYRAGAGPAMVYVDGREVRNPVALLRQMALSRVASIELLRPAEVSSRFGGSGRVGAVAIRTKSRG